MGIVELKHPLDLCLGLDQVGELYAAVMPRLAERETFMCEDRSPAKDDRVIIWAHGSRGTRIRAELTDKGWKTRRYE